MPTSRTRGTLVVVLHVLRRIVVLLALASLVVVAVAAGGSGRGEAGWVIRDLGTFGSSDAGAIAVAVNDRGQVVVQSGWRSEWLRGAVRSYVWEDGKVVDLGSLGGTITQAVAINDRGQVVGDSTTAAGAMHAFVWENRRLLDLGNIGRKGHVVGINERGQVIGYGYFGPYRRAVSWQDGRVRKLPLPLGMRHSAPVAINDRGWIVGLVSDGSRSAAVLWRQGRVTVLSTFRAAADVNEAGEIVGHAEDPADVERIPLVWRDGRISKLEALRCPDCRSARAYAISNAGRIVGVSQAFVEEESPDHAVTWDVRDGHVRDLGTLGGRNSYAIALNDLGQVIGVSEIGVVEIDGWDEYGIQHAFVSEKGTMSDLGALPRNPYSFPMAINGDGVVVGVSSEYPLALPPFSESVQIPSFEGIPVHAVLWEKTGA